MTIHFFFDILININKPWAFVSRKLDTFIFFLHLIPLQKVDFMEDLKWCSPLIKEIELVLKLPSTFILVRSYCAVDKKCEAKMCLYYYYFCHNYFNGFLYTVLIRLSVLFKGGLINMGVTKKELYRLIDALPKGEVEAARRFLEFLITQDPTVYSLISAPFDDEPTSEEEDFEAKKAWDEHIKSKSVSSDDAAKEIFGE